MKKMGLRILLVVAICAIGVMQADATIVNAQYTFTSGSLASTDSDTLSSAGSIVNGAGLSFSAASTSVGNPAGSFLFAKNDISQNNTFSQSFSNNKYFEFTITANAGYYLNLNGGNLTFDTQGVNSKSSSWAVTSSVLGYGTQIQSGTVSSGTWQGNTVALNGSGYDHVTSITFRIYGWQSDNIDMYFDNLTLNGFSPTPVPEPTNYAMAAFCVIILGGGVGRYYTGKLHRTAEVA